MVSRFGSTGKMRVRSLSGTVHLHKGVLSTIGVLFTVLALVGGFRIFQLGKADHEHDQVAIVLVTIVGDQLTSVMNRLLISGNRQHNERMVNELLQTTDQVGILNPASPRFGNLERLVRAID